MQHAAHDPLDQRSECGVAYAVGQPMRNGPGPVRAQLARQPINRRLADAHGMDFDATARRVTSSGKKSDEQLAENRAGNRHGKSPEQQLPEQALAVLTLRQRRNAQRPDRGQR